MPFRAMGRRVETRSSPGKEAEYLRKKNTTCGCRAAWPWMRAQAATARRERHFRASLQTRGSAVPSNFRTHAALTGWLGQSHIFTEVCGAWIAYLEGNKDIYSESPVKWNQLSDSHILSLWSPDNASLQGCNRTALPGLSLLPPAFALRAGSDLGITIFEMKRSTLLWTLLSWAKAVK